jgi:hypothetical protein
MVNILYLTSNTDQCKEFLYWILNKIERDNVLAKYNKENRTIQTKYATLYVRHISEDLFDTLPFTDYVMAKIDFKGLSIEQMTRIIDKLKILREVYPEINIQELKREKDIYTILAKGVSEYQRQCINRKIEEYLDECRGKISK